jgi:hypothetical protein
VFLKAVRESDAAIAGRSMRSHRIPVPFKI